MINELPTIFDVVTGVKQQRDTSGNHNSSNKNKSSGKMVRSEQPYRIAFSLFPVFTSILSSYFPI